jgi:predicted LPLAT superfamily acyltransferase
VTAEQGWTREKEHGSPGLVRLIIWLTLRLGWPVGQVLLLPITAYFFVTLSRPRIWSRHYLGRVLGRRPTVGDVWRHFFTFACVTLDRICFLANRTERFRIAVHGLDSLEAALASGRGCILLGSHLGSFEVLRAFGRSSPVPVRPLMYRGTTAALSTFMEELDPAIRQDVIEIGTPSTMLRVRESLARGEIVGILADRAPPGAQRFASAEFLGSPARFPTGPLALAAALQVPVVLFFGLRRGLRDYQVIIEPFADRIEPEPGPRTEALRRWAERYAVRLAAHCRTHPYNWFNFYDFWEQQPDVETTADPRDAARPGQRPGRRTAIVATD